MDTNQPGTDVAQAPSIPVPVPAAVAPPDASPRNLMSDSVVLQAPMSYTGSAKRIWKITKRHPEGWQFAFSVVAAVTLITFAWWVVTAWYVVTVVMFGLITIPYRLIRRGQRRDRRQQLQHREQLSAMQQIAHGRQDPPPHS